MADAATSTEGTESAGSGDTTQTTEGSASDTSTDGQSTGDTGQHDQSDEGDPAALGDAGKKALDAMKSKWKDADKQAKENAAALAALQAKLDGKEAEHQAEQEAQRIKDEALAAADQRILRAEIRAAAAGKLSDPADALRFLDLSEFEVGSDGEVDGDAVTAAIADLIKTKPYLAAQGSRFQGDADAGVRKETRPGQLSKSDLDRMTPEEISKAKKEGRLEDLLTGKR